MKKYGSIILFAFLVGVTIFSVVKFILTQRQNILLSDNIKVISAQINQLETQKTNLEQTIVKQTQENTELKSSLQTSQDRLARMEEDLNQAKKNIDDLQSEVSLVKTENTAMHQESETLKAQLAQSSQEKALLEARLNSLDSLKKAIHELKMKMFNEKVELRRRNNVQFLLGGNHGFVIKEGRFNNPSKVHIEVTPAP